MTDAVFSPEFQSQVTARRQQLEREAALATLTAQQSRIVYATIQAQKETADRSTVVMPQRWPSSVAKLYGSIQAARRTFLADMNILAGLLHERRVPYSLEVSQMGGAAVGWSIGREAAQGPKQNDGSYAGGVEELFLTGTGQLVRLRHRKYEIGEAEARAPFHAIPVASLMLDSTHILTPERFDYPLGQAQRMAADVVIRYQFA